MPRGELSSGKFAKRHPLDWYQEEPWVSGQLRLALNEFRDHDKLIIWDPAAGSGAIGATFAAWGHAVLLSDVVNRIDPEHFDPPSVAIPEFLNRDFLEIEEALMPCSIVTNPPYSYCKGHGDYAGMLISEAFARHAIKLVTACGGAYVCMLLPSKWLASQRRYSLFTTYPPAAVLHLTQRPSMPPGDRIAAMGNRAFRGGMVDYCWIVWDVRRPTRPGETRTIWLPPLGVPILPIEALA